MLSKIHRIPAGFFLKQKAGCKLLSSLSLIFSVRVCNNDLPVNRVAVIISKKNISKAVDRNYVRRVLYSIFSDKLKRIDETSKKNHDFILYIKKLNNNEIKYNDFEKDVEKLFKLFI